MTRRQTLAPLWRLSDWIQARSTGAAALIGLTLFLVFAATVLPAQARDAEAATQGAGSPDLSLFYTPQALLRMAEAYGQEGRSTYVRARSTFDVAWPAVYLFFLATAISWLYSQAAANERRWQLANLLPVGAVVFDLLENVSTSVVMLRFPAPSPVPASLAPVFTFTKWMLVCASVLILLAWAVVAGWRILRRR